MAKIVLVSKHVNATSWQLAQALRAQQHEVVLLTSYGEEPRDHSNIQFMAYFKKWNILEGLRILPRILGLQPQILHILLDDDHMSAGQVVLSTFAKSIPSCVLTTSLLNIRKGLSRRNPVRYLVEESDIVTCPTVETLGQLRGLNIRSTRQGRGILPPVLDLKTKEYDSFELELEHSEHQLLDSLQNKDFIVIPFNERRFEPETAPFIRIRTVAQKYKVVLWGSYAHWSVRERKKFSSWMRQHQCEDQWLVTGPLSDSMGQSLLSNCTAFMLAGQGCSPVEMTEYYLRAIRTKAVLILDSLQTSVHSDLWKSSLNCWVLNSHHLQKDLIKLLHKPHLRLPESLTESLVENRHLVDSSMNELNRLYNKALNQLR